MVKNHKEHPLLATQRDIELARVDISLRLERWRSLQADHMASAQNSLPSTSSAVADDEEPHLPSYFSRSERAEMSLSELAEEELALRRVQIVECIMQLRRSAKKLSYSRAQKKKHLPGQGTGTRATVIRNAIEFNQECLLLIYGVARHALIHLSEDNQVGEAFPPLTAADLYRKSTSHKRQLGDSRRSDGKLWVVGARVSMISDSGSHHGEDDAEGGGGGAGEASGDSDGKLWSPMIGLSIAEVEEWDREGERSLHKHSHLTPYHTKRIECNGIVLGRICNGGSRSSRLNI